MRKDINITEKNQYRINVKLAGVNDITEYIAYGAASHLGCQNHITQFDCQPSESGFTVIIPSLSAGIHQYEVYAKRISSNVEFLLLEGRIEVKNRLSDGGSISNNTNQIDVDVTFENGEINLEVSVTEGREGPQGERGAQGEKGDKGDKGDSVAFDTAPKSGSKNAVTSGGLYDILYPASVKLGRSSFAGSYAVAIGDGASTDTGSIAIGKSVSAKGGDAVAVGAFSSTTKRNTSTFGKRMVLKDTGCVLIGVWNEADSIATQLYLINAGSPMANTYEDGEACLGYIVKDVSGNIQACGTRKLSELLTNNTAFAPAMMDLDADPPTPFLPTGVTDPIEFPELDEE